MNTTKRQQTTTLAVPQLKKGQRVIYYGAIFEILEDAKNVSSNSLKLEFERQPIEKQAFGAKCKFISYEDGTGKIGDKLLENYDYFQGNSYAKHTVIK